MRALFLIAAVLTLSACGSDEQAANETARDDGLTADRIVANDVTAIDAVTGDAANMAADVNYTEVDNLAVNGTNSQSDSSPRTRRASPPAKAGAAPQPDNRAAETDEPATNEAE